MSQKHNFPCSSFYCVFPKNGLGTAREWDMGPTLTCVFVAATWVKSDLWKSVAVVNNSLRL